ncbi:MAG: hypothetical protein L0Y71_22775 [Gemmataceae bacterium]|nr:hypothetical protein [Gemmataceae bacterium]
MSIPGDADAKRFHKAFSTTEMADGPRALISAERIVIELGWDEAGRPLELSIPLEESSRPGVVTLYSINEPIFDAQRMRFVPETTVRTIGTNVIQVAIQYKSIEQLLAGAPAPLPDSSKKPICSFCGKKYPETGPLVEGAGPEGGGREYSSAATAPSCAWTSWNKSAPRCATAGQYPNAFA